MKTPAAAFCRSLIVLLPLLLGGGLAVVLLGPGNSDDSIFLESPGRKTADTVGSPERGVSGKGASSLAAQQIQSAGTDDPDRRLPANDQPATQVKKMPHAAAAGPLRSWGLEADPVPVSHWAPGTGGALPQRSGRLAMDATGLEHAMAGSEVIFPLFDGRTAAGTVRQSVEVEPGARIWSGRLSSPEGKFFIEKNANGWHGSLTLRGQPVAYRIFPGPPGHEGPWIERWARSEVECSQAGSTDTDPDSPGVDPALNVANLQSRPGASRVIFLDFNGGAISNTYWNSEYNEDNTINYADCGMSTEDRIRAWAHAAEDFQPFNVNVTTSGAAFNAASSGSRIRVAITPTKNWYGDDPDEEVEAKGGVAQVGNFGSSGVVVWVWNMDWLSAGETISHEAGHALGLRHSGYGNVTEFDFREYYRGHGEGANGWAPIMGYGAVDARYLTTWDNGSYPWHTSSQDQKANLLVYLTGVADDHGGSSASATSLTPEGTGPVFNGRGMLETSTDVDWFRLQLPTGTWAFQAWGNPFGKNVNLTIQVRNGLNQLLDETDWATSTDATSALYLEAGTYYLTVRSTTRPESSSDPGYPRYGQLGTYSVFVLPFGYEPTPPVVSFVSIAKFELGSPSAEVQVKYQDETLVDTATLGTGDIVMQRGNHPAINGLLVSNSGDGRQRYATYRFDAPGPDWDIGEGGTYRIFAPANAVKDDWGNGNVETTLASRALPDSDPNPPVVTIPGGLGNATNGETAYDFRVACTDIAPVLVSEAGKNCIEVRRVTAGESLYVSIPSVPVRTGAVSSNYNKSWTMDYRLAPPGGEWDDTDVGEYQVWLRSGKIRDVNGNFAPAQKVGTFYMRKKMWERTFEETGPQAIFTFDSGWSTGEPQGTGGYQHDPASAWRGDRVLGYRLGSGDAALYQNGLTTTRYAVSPAINVSGYRNLSIQFRRWLSVAAGDRVRVQASRDGSAWTTVWQNQEDTAIFDGSWKLQEINLPPAIADNAAGLRFRFGLGTTDGEQTAGGWNVDDIKIIAAGIFNPGRLILTNVGSSVTEGAAIVRVYTVRLDQAPASSVTVEIDPGTQLDTSRTSLTFTAANYSTPQQVVLSAVDDNVVEGDKLTVLTHKVTSTTDPAFFGVRSDLLITVVDNDAPLIETQPEDRAVAPGQSAVFRVVPFSTALKAYQWYYGNRGDTSNPIPGATGALQSILLPVGTTQPMPVWVRVRLNLVGGNREDSQTALLSPLKGYAAWKSLLKNHGYSNDVLDAPGFDAADPDGDGLGHFMEYAFGGQPYTADQGRLPKVSLERSSSSGGSGGIIGLPGKNSGTGQRELVLTFGPSKADVRYITETSPDMGRWQIFRTTAASSTTTLPGRLPPGDTIIRIPVNDDAAVFARIRAEYDPP